MKTPAFFSFVLLGIFCVGAQAQDVQMNQPDDFGALGNSTTQSETNHAVTANGILAAWNDSRQFAAGVLFASKISWGYSADSGASFTGGGFFTPPDNNCLGDPAVVADGSGFFYLAALATPSLDSRKLKNVAVARSTGNTAPFGFEKPVILAPLNKDEHLDKELMAIDRTGGAFKDRIYISATEPDDFGERIVVAHTTSLSPLLEFSKWQYITPDRGSATGSMPAVAPNGEVYVIWTMNDNALQIVKSADGGDSFVNPDVSEPACAHPPCPKTIATFARPMHLSSPRGEINASPLAQIAVDSTAAGSPTRGNLYVVFAADPDGSGQDKSDVYFTRSTNGGATWAAPRSITSGLAVTLGCDLTKNDSWMPSIAVSPVNGHIYVTFYDRRIDTTAADGDPVNTKTRVFRALSTDGGLTWSNAPAGASTFVPIIGFERAGDSNNYWGEYNWSTADVGGLHFTWGDSHNPCVPPSGGSSLCSPQGRPDLDVYYHKTANLSGADLFIQPWGAVTGIGPQWQTPAVFVVDSSGSVVNARKGFVNDLRARVRNLGSLAASGVVVRFRYAPWFAGVNDSLLKEIGTVRLDFSVAGGGADDQLAAIDWDLTDTSDTNGSSWPAPISAFDHFCVKVSVEFTGDINPSNNVAQSNFADVAYATLPTSEPLSFMVVGPDGNVDPQPKLAQLRISPLPGVFHATVSVKGVGDPAAGFLLKPNEIRLAKVRFAAPLHSRISRDVVADISLLLDGKPAGGISGRLYRSPEQASDFYGIGPVTSDYWNVKPPEKPPDQPSTKGYERPLPPPRVIPGEVKYRRQLAASYEEVFQVAVASFQQKQAPADVNRERGLINSRSIHLTAKQIRRRVVAADRKWVKGDGYAILSFYFQPLAEDQTEIGAASLIAVADGAESPLGLVLTSNGTLEKRYLDAMTASVQRQMR